MFDTHRSHGFHGDVNRPAVHGKKMGSWVRSLRHRQVPASLNTIHHSPPSNSPPPPEICKLVFFFATVSTRRESKVRDIDDAMAAANTAAQSSTNLPPSSVNPTSRTGCGKARLTHRSSALPLQAPPRSPSAQHLPRRSVPNIPLPRRELRESWCWISPPCPTRAPPPSFGQEPTASPSLERDATQSQSQLLVIVKRPTQEMLLQKVSLSLLRSFSFTHEATGWQVAGCGMGWCADLPPYELSVGRNSRAFLPLCCPARNPASC